MLKAFQFRPTWNLFVGVVQRDILSVLSSLVAFGFAYYLIDLDYSDASYLHRMAKTWLLASASGISLFLAIRLWSRTAQEKWILSAIGGLILAIFATWHVDMGSIRDFRMIQWFALTHLLVALAPLRDHKGLSVDENDNQVWRFNWFILTRFIFGGLFCAAMALGLCGAMVALEKLFGVDFKGDDFGKVNAFVFFVVSVFQVLSSITDTRVGPQSSQVTSDLRRLIQYLLTPLSLIYFSIAYAYIVKMAIKQAWPQGVVGVLISALVGTVFLTYLLQRPLSKVSSFPSWMSAFWKWSFALLIPPLIVLMMAIWRRVHEYGLTELRVTAVILALWAIGICFYYFKPGRRGIAMIPLSLTIVGVATFAGPLSPHFIAYRSQKHELHKVIQEAGGKLVNGKYEWPSPTIQFWHVKRMDQILRYFCREFQPASMFEALNVPVPEGVTGYESSIQCWGNSDATPIEIAKTTLGIRGAPTAAPRKEDVVNFEDGRDYGFRAGETEFANFSIGNYTNTSKRGPSKNLKFTYECCGTILTWTPETGKPIQIEMDGLLRQKVKQLEVKGERGVLTLFLRKARATESEGKLTLTRDMELDAIFSPGGGAERTESTY